MYETFPNFFKFTAQIKKITQSEFAQNVLYFQTKTLNQNISLVL